MKWKAPCSLSASGLLFVKPLVLRYPNEGWEERCNRVSEKEKTVIYTTSVFITVIHGLKQTTTWNLSESSNSLEG
ncbi:hypothetical protein [Gorillibacterium timonense]|uniref:hypothetical protein n=1 Tax=Gorillibacterium timonense TaxID=1689269 RepID=UPI0011DD5010|nr:hypothetical protein [Gorillibacterium timonense]